MEVYYVPDTQILFPELFLFDVDVSSVAHYKLYKECFRILLECHHAPDRGTIVLFPAIHEDFTRLLVCPYQNFLRSTVMYHAQRATDIEDLRNRVLGMVKSVPKFLDYWELRWKKYREWIPFNKEKIDSFITRRIMEVSGRFGDYYFAQKMGFSLDEEKVGANHMLLHSRRESGILPKDVDFNDLRILASCLVFMKELSPEGILYFFTDDGALRRSAQIEIGQLVEMYPDEDMTRFKVQDPKEILLSKEE